MPLKIIRQDIIYMPVDAIVSSVSQEPSLTLGVHLRIHEVAGPELFLARQKLGTIYVSKAFITPGYQLLAKYVIHAHSPNYKYRPSTAPKLLYETYMNCLMLAKAHQLKSIAFPLLSSGRYAFPKDQAIEIARQAIHDFLENYDMDIYLVVFDEDSFEISKKYQNSVDDYLVRNYRPKIQAMYDVEDIEDEEEDFDDEADEDFDGETFQDQVFEVQDMVKAITLQPDVLEQTFSDVLFEFIRQKRIDEVALYKNAMLSRQTFSKIRSDQGYLPNRDTVFLCAIGMKLNLKETKRLLASAGYAFNLSSKFEVILQYFIESGIYDFNEIDTILLQYDQKTLRKY
jgi:O-acetyl-ADP-ribose deacetylase